MTSKQTASPKKAGSRSLLHERDTDVVASMLEKILAGNQVVAARLERVESILEQGGRGGGLVASSKQTRVLKIEDIMSKTHKDLTKAPKMSSALVPNIAGQPQQKRSLKGLLAKAAQSNAKQARVHPDGAVLEEHSPAPMAPRSSKFHHSADGLDSDLVRAQHELEVITDAKSCLATEASSLHGELQPREFLVIPQNAHPKQLWDLTMLVLAIITCVLTPIQIGFPIAGLESGSFLMYSAVVDVMFLIDVLLGFVTSFTVHSSYDIEVLQLKRTALNYLKTWFLLDVLASIPFSLIRQLSGGSVSSGAAFNKALRLAKLLKLLRLLRFKRLIPKLDVYPIFSHPALRLPPLIVCLLYYIHVGACFLHLVLSDQAAELGLVTFPDLYGWSIGWTIALTFGNAYPYQDADFVKITGEFSHGTISVLMLLGVFVQGIILTRVVIIALDLRQQTQHRNEQRLRLKVLLSVKRVPPELRLQCIRHFDHYWLAEGDSEEWAHVLEGLSSQLRKQLLMHTHKSLLGSSLFIEIAKTAGGRKAMLINMLEKMRTLVSTPPDIVLHPNTAPAGLFVIDEGECAVFDRGTRCFELGRGDFFGEELLTGELAKFKVQAVTPCTLHVLLEPQFQEFLTRFPDLRSQITRSQQKARALRRVKPPSIGDASTSHTLIRSYTKAISSTMDLAGGGRLGTRAIREKEIQGFVDLPAMYDESQEYDILLLRAEWLIELYRKDGRLERRQDLPPEAFYRGRLEIRAIVAVSYPWLGKEHPDNDGWHLGILGRLLELFCDLYGDAAVFIDFCSLYQHPPHGGERSAKEDTLFKMSLQGLKHLYAHQATWVFCLKSIPPGSQVPAYDSRGWPTFETAISSWIKGSRKLLDISLLAPPEGLISFLDGCESWHDDVHARCVARRDQPLSPAKFSALLGTKTFTNGNDCEVVAGLYADVFVEVFSQVQELDFSGLTWTHLDNLIDTLKDASAKTVGMTCPNLKFLWFFDHVIDEPKAVRTRLQEAVGDGCEVFGLDD